MSLDEFLGRVLSRVATKGLSLVVFVLIHTYMVNEELGRKGLTEAGIHTTSTFDSLAVVVRTSRWWGRKTP